MRQIQSQFIGRTLTPADVRDDLLTLTGLLGNVLDEAREADYDYHVLVAAFVESGDAVNRAEMRGKATAQYRRAREAKDTERLVLEMIRASKHYLESLDTEMRLAR